jgi:hypothetical protein
VKNNSPNTKESTKNPIIVAIRTKTDRSLILIKATIPVKKADIPDNPANNIGIDITRLSKKVSSPCWPEAIITMANRKNKTNPPINPIAHFPRAVMGRNLVVIERNYIHAFSICQSIKI